MFTIMRLNTQRTAYAAYTLIRLRSIAEPRLYLYATRYRPMAEAAEWNMCIYVLHPCPRDQCRSLITSRLSH